MSNGNLGCGIIGFIIGILSCGFYVFFRRKKPRPDYTIHDAHHNELDRVNKY